MDEIDSDVDVILSDGVNEMVFKNIAMEWCEELGDREGKVLDKIIRMKADKTPWIMAVRDVVKYIDRNFNTGLEFREIMEHKYEMMELFQELYDDDEWFRDKVTSNTIVITHPSRDDIEGIDTFYNDYSHLLEPIEDGDEEDDSSYEDVYPWLYDRRAIDESGEVDNEKLMSFAMAFSNQINEIEGGVPKPDMGRVSTKFNSFMVDRVGSEWLHFVTNELNPGDVRKICRILYNKNDTFSDRINESWEYEQDGDVDVKDTMGRVDKQRITEYARTVGEADDIRASTSSDKEHETAPEMSIELNGENIIHGDSREVIDYLVDNYSSVIDAIVTDPPYGMDYDSRGDHHDTIKGDEDVTSAVELTEYVLKKCRILLRDGSPLVVFCSSESYSDFKDILEKWYTFQDSNVWYKKHVGTSAMHGNIIKWRSNHEYAHLATKGDPRITNDNRHDGNVWEFQRKSGGNMRHPTEKPVELMRYIIESVTEEGDLVADFFAGSGPVPVAARGLNREFLAVEYSEEWYNVIQNRMAQQSLTQV